eukprot:975525-Prorocentrum_lima.AAC.1
MAMADGSYKPPLNKDRTLHRHIHTLARPRRYATPRDLWINVRGILHPHAPLSQLFYHEMRRIAERRRIPYMLTDWEPSEEPSDRMRDAFYDATV